MQDMMVKNIQVRETVKLENEQSSIYEVSNLALYHHIVIVFNNMPL